MEGVKQPAPPNLRPSASHLPRNGRAPFGGISVTCGAVARWCCMSRSRRLRDLSGAPAFDQLRAELARAADSVAGARPPRRKAIDTSLRPASAEPDEDGGETAPPGSG
ncbi:hypothetical protein SY2F82_15440 [Streptomyces sp. Y2F8-2]|nr:hypothetical protein SY2F82_15440 [Streptomyces sp. Y2F8-2]